MYEKEDKGMTEAKRCVFKKARCSLVGECHDLFFFRNQIREGKGKTACEPRKNMGEKEGNARCLHRPEKTVGTNER